MKDDKLIRNNKKDGMQLLMSGLEVLHCQLMRR